MANYRPPEVKATETVTFRLTLKERRLLGYLARIEGKTLTDLVRDLIAKRAAELEIHDVPKPPPKRRPGRPKKPRKVANDDPAPEALEEAPSVESGVEQPGNTAPMDGLVDFDEDPQIPVTLVPPEPPEMTIGDIIARFRNSFSHRAEGTKKEFEDAIAFFCHPGKGFPLLDIDTPVSALSSQLLSRVREGMKPLNLRVAKKNLHLTYLRMVLHWAVKEPGITLQANPALALSSFTISEIPESWPGKYFPED